MLRGLRVGIVTLCMAILGGFAPAAVAQDATPVATTGARSAEWLRFDVDLELHADGILHLTEHQEVVFHGGPFTMGFATIPLRNIEGIDGVRVHEELEGGQVQPYQQVAADATTSTPNTFRVRTDAGFVNIDWWFPPTSDARRTFVLEYDVRGALRFSTENGERYGEIWWIAVDAEVTEAAPVRSATATLRLPAAADPSKVLVSPDGYVPTASGDWSVWTWTRTDLSPGDRFSVRLRFPAEVLSGPAATPSA